MNVANMTGTPEQLAKLFTKMANVAGKITKIGKSGWNDYHKYAFATDGDVSDAVRPLLAEEGIAIFVSMVHVEQHSKNTLAEFAVTYADSETGATFTCNWFSEANDSQDKGVNKAATAGLKYHLLKNFLISTGDSDQDPDAQAPVEGAKKVETWVDDKELDSAWEVWLSLVKEVEESSLQVNVPKVLKSKVQPEELRAAYKKLKKAFANAIAQAAVAEVEHE